MNNTSEQKTCLIISWCPPILRLQSTLTTGKLNNFIKAKYTQNIRILSNIFVTFSYCVVSYTGLYILPHHLDLWSCKFVCVCVCFMCVCVSVCVCAFFSPFLLHYWSESFQKQKFLLFSCSLAVNLCRL